MQMVNRMINVSSCSPKFREKGSSPVDRRPPPKIGEHSRGLGVPAARLGASCRGVMTALADATPSGWVVRILASSEKVSSRVRVVVGDRGKGETLARAYVPRTASVADTDRVASQHDLAEVAMPGRRVAALCRRASRSVRLSVVRLASARRGQGRTAGDRADAQLRPSRHRRADSLDASPRRA